MGDVVDINHDKDTVLYRLAKSRFPQVVQKGTEKATFDELKQAVIKFCDTHYAITEVGVLDCPEWFAKCYCIPSEWVQ